MADKDRKALVDRIEAQEIELASLRALIARTNPDAIYDTLPAPVLEYTPDIGKKMIALGAIGLAPAEVLLECGINNEKNKLWGKTIPEYKTALLRARDAATVKQMRAMREAIAHKDWRFPYANAMKMVDMLMQYGADAPDIGDASSNIILDLSK